MSTSIASRLLFAFIVLSLCCSQSPAKGGNMANQNPYKTQYVESLPPEVARHSFSSAVVRLKLYITSPATLKIPRESCCASSIFTAIQAALFAALPDACIKSTFPHTATTGSYEVTTFVQRIELRLA